MQSKYSSCDLILSKKVKDKNEK